MSRITVAVSPFYGGEEWTDEFTGITFKKDEQHQMAVYSIPENKNLTGIAKAILLNALILVDGDLDTPEQPVKVAPEPVKSKEPEVSEELTEAPEEPATEPEEVEAAQEKKTAAARKKTTTKK